MAQRWVLHVDMDQFLVAVELLRRPELIGLPVIVGGRGDPTERAVVSTASYEARARGVHSGLALKLAVRRCLEAVLLPVDFPVYEAASAEVMATLRALPGAIVEVLGWDEAFVGVETDDPHRTALEIWASVFARTQLHCSIGIGDTLVRAKIATDFGKPQGTYFLHRDNWLDVMGHRPTTALWGVGTKIGQRLAAIGLDTVAQLAASPATALKKVAAAIKAYQKFLKGLGFKKKFLFKAAVEKPIVRAITQFDGDYKGPIYGLGNIKYNYGNPAPSFPGAPEVPATG